MFTIGDFATMGRVSIRMLRHYDQIGLLRPARVDEFTGYRYYEADQLRRLNRLVALKDLGFTLAEVAKIVDSDISTPELRGMLQLRQTQVAEQIRFDGDRLVRIEARLRMIEREGAMSTNDVTVKAVDPVRIASVGGVADSNNYESVGPVISSLFGRLFESLGAAGVEPAGDSFGHWRTDLVRHRRYAVGYCSVVDWSEMASTGTDPRRSSPGFATRAHVCANR